MIGDLIAARFYLKESWGLSLAYWAVALVIGTILSVTINIILGFTPISVLTPIIVLAIGIVLRMILIEKLLDEEDRITQIITIAIGIVINIVIAIIVLIALLAILGTILWVIF